MRRTMSVGSAAHVSKYEEEKFYDCLLALRTCYERICQFWTDVFAVVDTVAD